jgi:hypothetical protein
MKPTQFKLIIPAIWILFLVFCICSSCNRNRLKTYRKKLVKQIFKEERQQVQQKPDGLNVKNYWLIPCQIAEKLSV